MISHIVNRDDLFPRVLVSVRAPAEIFGKQEVKDNLGVVEWHMPASISPTKYAISVKNNDHISKMISKAGNFVINFMGYDQRSIVLSCESQDGVLTDLFDFLGITKAEADMVESPRIREAKEVLECEVEHELESGDHIIFIGRVVGPRA